MHFCATFNTFVHLTVTSSSTKFTEVIVMFPLQQWLSKSVAMLCYKYFSYIVVHNMGNSCEKKNWYKENNVYIFFRAKFYSQATE
jgi:hypothetical protein